VEEFGRSGRVGDQRFRRARRNQALLFRHRGAL
jgi:hypothetical protein